MEHAPSQYVNFAIYNILSMGVIMYADWAIANYSNRLYLT